MKLKLRKYSLKDLDAHIKLFQMNETYSNITEKIKSQEKGWLKKVISNYRRTNPSFYVKAITLNEKLIGNFIAENFNSHEQTFEIGFWIGKDYWNRGYTSKALNLFLKDVKKKFKPTMIIAHCKYQNLASKRVLEKAGFKFKIKNNNLLTFSKQF